MYIKIEEAAWGEDAHGAYIHIHKIILYEDDGSFRKILTPNDKIVDILKGAAISYNVQALMDFKTVDRCASCGGENITHRYHRNEYICYKCESYYNEK